MKTRSVTSIRPEILVVILEIIFGIPYLISLALVQVRNKLTDLYDWRYGSLTAYQQYLSARMVTEASRIFEHHQDQEVISEEDLIRLFLQYIEDGPEYFGNCLHTLKHLDYLHRKIIRNVFNDSQLLCTQKFNRLERIKRTKKMLARAISEKLNTAENESVYQEALLEALENVIARELYHRYDDKSVPLIYTQLGKSQKNLEVECVKEMLKSGHHHSVEVYLNAEHDQRWIAYFGRFKYTEIFWHAIQYDEHAMPSIIGFCK